MTQSQRALALIEYPYTFEDHPVRVIMRDGEPWFVAADVCKALHIDATAIRKLDDDEKGLHSMQTLSSDEKGRGGGDQFVAVISEPGLHTLILRCRDAVKPGTLPHRFRRWVTHEVLPSIRKTGGYSTDPAREALIQSVVAEVVAAASRTVYQALASGKEPLDYRTRWVFSLEPPRKDGKVIPWCTAIDFDAHIASLTQLAEMIMMPNGIGVTEAELAGLALACTQQLNKRIDNRITRL